MSFASDGFAGAAATELNAYSALWVKLTGYTANMNIGVSGQYACCFDSSAAACYRNTSTPGGANYSVAADVMRLAVSTYKPSMGVCARMSSSANTMYWTFHVDSANETRLYKTVSGAQTLLGSYSNTLTTNSAQRHTLDCNNTTIAVKINGTTRISVTDSAISAAGFAGLIGFTMREPSVQDTGSIDAWAATDAAVVSDLSGTPVLDEALAAGAMGSSSSDLSGTPTLDPALAGGTLGVQPGVITTTAFLNKFTGAPLPLTTIPKVCVLRVSDMGTVLTLANVTSDSSARLVITDAMLSPGVKYLVITCNSDGSAYGAEVFTAA